MTAERAAFAEQQDTEQYARGAGPTPRQRPPGPSPTRHAHPQRGPHTGRPSPSRYQTAPRPKQAPSTGSTGGSRVCPRAVHRWTWPTTESTRWSDESGYGRSVVVVRGRRRYASWMVLDTSLGTRKLLLDIFVPVRRFLRRRRRRVTQCSRLSQAVRLFV